MNFSRITDPQNMACAFIVTGLQKLGEFTLRGVICEIYLVCTPVRF